MRSACEFVQRRSEDNDDGSERQNQISCVVEKMVEGIHVILLWLRSQQEITRRGQVAMLYLAHARSEAPKFSRLRSDVEG
jgi:hypothetical protein